MSRLWEAHLVARSSTVADSPSHNRTPSFEHSSFERSSFDYDNAPREEQHLHLSDPAFPYPMARTPSPSANHSGGGSAHRDFHGRAQQQQHPDFDAPSGAYEHSIYEDPYHHSAPPRPYASSQSPQQSQTKTPYQYDQLHIT